MLLKGLHLWNDCDDQNIKVGLLFNNIQLPVGRGGVRNSPRSNFLFYVQRFSDMQNAL